MDFKNWQGVKKLFSATKHIWIIFGPDANGDLASAALGLNSALALAGKSVEVAGVPPWPSKLSFLPGHDLIAKTIQPQPGTLVVSIARGKGDLEEFWYEEEGDKVKVFIAPKRAKPLRVSEAKLTTVSEAGGLVVSLGLSAPEQAGSFYDQAAPVLYENPIINIDNSVENIGYGQMNFIDLTRASVSEMVLELLNETDLPVSGDVATALLTGLILRTNSFQNVKTNPKALFAASRLMAQGADQPQIIRRLYKTRSFSHLKLWGRALSRLTVKADTGLAYAQLNYEDLSRLQGTAAELDLIWRDFKNILADIQVLLLFAETEPGVAEGFVRTRLPLNFKDILTQAQAKFDPQDASKFAVNSEKIIFIREKIEAEIKHWLNSNQQV